MTELLLFLGECCFFVFAVSAVAVFFLLHDANPAPEWVEEDEIWRNRWNE